MHKALIIQKKHKSYEKRVKLIMIFTPEHLVYNELLLYMKKKSIFLVLHSYMKLNSIDEVLRSQYSIHAFHADIKACAAVNTGDKNLNICPI